MSLEMYISPTLRVLLCIKTLIGQVMCLKRLIITVLFDRSEPFHLLRMMGFVKDDVSAIPTYRVYQTLGYVFFSVLYLFHPYTIPL